MCWLHCLLTWRNTLRYGILQAGGACVVVPHQLRTDLVSLAQHCCCGLWFRQPFCAFYLSRLASRTGQVVCFSSKSGDRLVRAIRPVPIKLITVSKGSNAGSSAMSEEWAAKLRRYTQLTEHAVKSNPKKASDPVVVVAGEAERVLRLLDPQVTTAEQMFYP